MRIFITFLLLVFSSGVTRAAVTVAWKVPIESHASDFRSDDRYRKLDQPPAASAFFQAGDELWDVSEAIPWPRGFKPTKTEPKDEKGEGKDPFAADPSEDWDWNGEPDGKWDGEWVVWNARSRMFIARGSWEDVRQIEAGLKFNGYLEVLRTKLELVEGGGLPRGVSLVSRSGEKAAIDVNGFKLEVEAQGGDRIAVNVATLSASWPSGEEGSVWELSTALNPTDAKRVRVAGYGEGVHGWELFASVQRERLDGTPLALARWIEERGGLVPWPVPKRREDSMLTREAGEGYKLMLLWAGRNLPLQLAGPGNEIPSVAVELPEKAADLLRGSVIDLRPHLAQNGIKLDDAREFAGFDPVSEHLLIITHDEGVDTIEEVFSGFTSYPGPCQWVATNPEAGGWHLTTLSGEKSTVARRKGGETELLFETELTVGNSDTTSELSYELKPGKGKLMKSSTTLTRDVPREAGSFTAADGREVKVILTAGSDPR
jgi:hypothetical protein